MKRKLILTEHELDALGSSLKNEMARKKEEYRNSDAGRRKQMIKSATYFKSADNKLTQLYRAIPIVMRNGRRVSGKLSLDIKKVV